MPLEPVAPTYPGEVADRWRYRDGGGEIGVIASVTQPFCATCTRARLTAEGQLFTCLFGVRGTTCARRSAAARTTTRCASGSVRVWAARVDRYSELRSEATVAAAEGGDVAHRRLSPALARGRCVRAPVRYAVAVHRSAGIAL